MVRTDAETDPRTEKEKLEFDHIPRGTSAIGRKVAVAGTEQERVHRESGAGRSVFNPRPTLTGKMLDHLIDEYEDQVANKKYEIAQIEIRVEELRLLREELKLENQE